MDLDLWAQLNLIGHVSYSEYLAMEPGEAQALYLALKNAIEQTQANPQNQPHAGFDELCKRYGG